MASWSYVSVVAWGILALDVVLGVVVGEHQHYRTGRGHGVGRGPGEYCNYPMRRRENELIPSTNVRDLNYRVKGNVDGACLRLI